MLRNATSGGCRKEERRQQQGHAQPGPLVHNKQQVARQQQSNSTADSVLQAAQHRLANSWSLQQGITQVTLLPTWRR